MDSAGANSGILPPFTENNLLCKLCRVKAAYKCRAYPTPEQAQMLSRTFGCVRVVWNRTLAARHAAFAVDKKSISYKDTDAALTEWKKTEELGWLAEVSSVPLQQTLRHQHSAFQAFFAKRARYPRFKSRQGRQSAHYTRSAFRIRNGGLWLAKTSEPLKVAWSWPEVDLATLNPTMVVVSREPDGRFFVTFAVDADDPTPLPATGDDVGVDLGLKDFAVLSTGERIAHPRDMDRHERQLKRSSASWPGRRRAPPIGLRPGSRLPASTPGFETPAATSCTRHPPRWFAGSTPSP
jgi:putative transposase